MRHIKLVIILTMISYSAMRADIWDDISDAGTRVVEKAQEIKQDVGRAVENITEKVQQVKDTIASVTNSPVYKKIQEGVTIYKNAKNMPKEPAAQYCATLPVATTIDNQPNPDGLNEAIKKYMPIFYLHPQERALPINAPELTTSSGTSIEFQKAGSKTVEVPRGQVTAQKIWELVQHAKDPKYAQGIIYFKNDLCVRFGSNPDNFKGPGNTLTVPVYAYAFPIGSEEVGINYLTLYGLNSPYEIRDPVTGNVLLPGGGINKGVIDVQNFHEADLEHITLVLDRLTLELKRIYYGSHGRHEGFWLEANHPDVEYEGTHPVAYVAKGGHGIYPMKGYGNNPALADGEYVRIHGLADDVISKRGKKWTPQVIRIYKYNEPGFDPNIMAWTAWGAGKNPAADWQYSQDGVQGAESQDWFGNVTQDIGRSYKDAPFCGGDTCKSLYLNEAIGNLPGSISIIKLRKEATIPK